MRPSRPLGRLVGEVCVLIVVTGCRGSVANAPSIADFGTGTQSSTNQAAGPTPERSSETPVAGAEVVDHPNLQIAARLLRSGQFLDAEIVLRSILRERPSCARATFLLGVAVMKQKRYAQARELLEASLAAGQPFADVRQVEHFLGWCCYYLGDLDAAKRAFQAHVHAVATAADSYFGLGVIAIDEDRIADAEQALERSIELLPPSPQGDRDRAKALARLGDCALRKERTEEALALYEESSRIFSHHAEVWGKLARIYDQTSRPEDAAAARLKQEAISAAAAGEGDAP